MFPITFLFDKKTTVMGHQSGTSVHHN